MLMDLFHSTLPERFHNSRRRVHFHAFMIDVHKRNHAYVFFLCFLTTRTAEF